MLLKRVCVLRLMQTKREEKKAQLLLQYLFCLVIQMLCVAVPTFTFGKHIGHSASQSVVCGSSDLRHMQLAVHAALSTMLEA